MLTIRLLRRFLKDDTPPPRSSTADLPRSWGLGAIAGANGVGIGINGLLAFVAPASPATSSFGPNSGEQAAGRDAMLELALLIAFRRSWPLRPRAIFSP
jgi:hypothetical protein